MFFAREKIFEAFFQAAAVVNNGTFRCFRCTVIFKRAAPEHQNVLVKCFPLRKLTTFTYVYLM